MPAERHLQAITWCEHILNSCHDRSVRRSAVCEVLVHLLNFLCRCSSLVLV